MKQSDVKKHFDDVAGQYGGWYGKEDLSAYFFRVRKEKVMGMMGAHDGRRVLDIGCGPGIMVNEILDKKCELYGIDISEKMLEEAARKASDHPLKNKAHFSAGSAENTGFPSNHFDVVLGMGLIEYLDDPKQALREIVRVMRPGGELIISFCNKASFYNETFRYVGTPVKHAYHKLKRTPFIYHRMYTEKTARKLIEGLNLKEEETVYYGANIMPFPMNFLFRPVSVGLAKKLENNTGSRVHTGFLVRYRKSRTTTL